MEKTCRDHAKWERQQRPAWFWTPLQGWVRQRSVSGELCPDSQEVQSPVLWHSELSCSAQHWYPILECQFKSLRLCFQFSFLFTGPGKTADDNTSTWVPAIHVGHQNRIPDSCLWLGPVVVWPSETVDGKFCHLPLPHIRKVHETHVEEQHVGFKKLLVPK